MIGSAGNDTLEGGSGGDAYVFGRGGSQDLIREKDAQMAPVGQTDRLLFEAGVSADRLWFKRAGNYLDISVVGTSDRVSIQPGTSALKVASSVSRPQMASTWPTVR